MYIDILKPEQFGRVKPLMDYAFAEPQFFEKFLNTMTQPSDWLGVFSDNNRLQGVLCAKPYILSLHGASVNTCYIINVAIAPEARGRGYFKPLMREILTRSAEKYPLVLLKAIESSLYTPFGFAFSHNHLRYQLPIHELNHFKIDAELDLQYSADPLQQLSELADIYRQALCKHNAFIMRSATDWRQLLTVNALENVRTVLAYKAGRPCGYMLYGIANNTLTITEMLYTEPTVKRSFLAYAAKHGTQAKQIFWRTFAEDLTYTELNITQYADTLYPQLSPFMMSRIVNVQEALSHLARQREFNGTMLLRVCDPLLPNNNGVFSITEQGCNSAQGQPLLTVSIEVLTQLASGYLSVAAAVRNELLQIHDPAVLNSLPALFAATANYINEEF